MLVHLCKPGVSADVIRSHIAAGADVNERTESGVAVAGATPLIMAAYYNLVDVAELLLQARALVSSVDGSGKTAAMRAVEQGSRETCWLLLSRGANLPLEYQLIYAAQVGDNVAAARMLQTGMSVNVKDKGVDDTRGGSPIRWAAAFGNTETAALFLSADTHELEAALTLAIIGGHEQIISLLEQELALRSASVP